MLNGFETQRLGEAVAAFLIQVQGINLAATLGDSQDLSTIRGGSFLLLEAIRVLGQWLAKASGVVSCEPLSLGGSVGLFRLELAHRAAAAKLCQEVEAWLAGRGLEAWLAERGVATLRLCHHLTFAVDVVEETDPCTLDDRDGPATTPVERVADAFIEDRERLLALNRWWQMQAPAVAPVATQEADGRAAKDRICEVDLVRPAASRETFKGQDHWVSDSVADRRRYGVDQKFRFYGNLLQEAGLDEPTGYAGYALHTKDIADVEPQERPREKDGRGRNLFGKIAVFYADGNGFGALQASLIKATTGEPPYRRLQQFDQRLRNYRRQLLYDVLIDLAETRWGINHDPDERTRNAQKAHLNADAVGEPVLRLETLYWAGDEGIWIVPASLGWRLANLFFRTTLGLDGQGRPLPRAGWRFGEREPVHHAAGLVFCHHDAPIARVRDLVEDLAGLCKEQDRGHSLLAYQVLESFDHVGRDLRAFRRQRCPRGILPQRFLLRGDRLDGLLAAAVALKRQLPRRQVKALAMDLHRFGASSEVAAREARLAEEFEGGKEGFERALAGLRRCFGSGPALWLHLDDLWDFLVQPPEEASEPC